MRAFLGAQTKADLPAHFIGTAYDIVMGVYEHLDAIVQMGTILEQTADFLFYHFDVPGDAVGVTTFQGTDKNGRVMMIPAQPMAYVNGVRLASDQLTVEAGGTRLVLATPVAGGDQVHIACFGFNADGTMFFDPLFANDAIITMINEIQSKRDEVVAAQAQITSQLSAYDGTLADYLANILELKQDTLLAALSVKLPFLNAGFEIGKPGMPGAPYSWRPDAPDLSVFLAHVGLQAQAPGDSAYASTLSLGSTDGAAGPWWSVSKLFQVVGGDALSVDLRFWSGGFTPVTAAQAASAGFLDTNDALIELISYDSKGVALSTVRSQGLSQTVWAATGAQPASQSWLEASFPNLQTHAQAVYAELRLVAANGSAQGGQVSIYPAASQGNHKGLFDDINITSAQGNLLIEVNPALMVFNSQLAEIESQVTLAQAAATLAEQKSQAALSSATDAATSAGQAGTAAGQAQSSVTLAGEAATSAAEDRALARAAAAVATEHGRGNYIGKSVFEDGDQGGWGLAGEGVGVNPVPVAHPLGRTQALAIPYDRATYSPLDDWYLEDLFGRSFSADLYVYSPSTQPVQVGLEAILAADGSTKVYAIDAVPAGQTSWTRAQVTISGITDGISSWRPVVLTPGVGMVYITDYFLRDSSSLADVQTVQQQVADSKAEVFGYLQQTQDFTSSAQDAASQAATFASDASTSATDAAGSAASASSSAGAAATSANDAGDKAAAAAVSSQDAQTAANDASTYATSALDSKTVAASQAALATTKADDASTAATNAAGSAASASSSQTVAARVASQGVSVLKDQFLGSASGVSVWQPGVGSVTAAANEIYPVGQTWDMLLADADQNGLVLNTLDAGVWPGVMNADAYAVQVEFTLVSGSLSGAGVILDWINDAASAYRAAVPLSSMLSGPVVLGQPMVASMVMPRPAAFVGTFARHKFFAMGNYATGLGALAAKELKIHRIQVRPATAEEQGGGVVGSSISAAVNSEATARANAVQAVATDVSNLSASVDGLTATVDSQGTAIADIQGFVSATYTFRAKAGTASAQLELIASSTPSGDASIARISADDIILNGTVTMNHMQVGSLDASVIGTGKLSATYIAITSPLALTDPNAGFSFGKSSATDYSTDGLFMGMTPAAGGGAGFGFLLGKTAPVSGLTQSIQHTTDSGLILTNANFAFNAGSPTNMTVTSSQTLALPVGAKTLSITALGGGGGGMASGGTVGPPGGTTTVKLFDGTTDTGISWTSAGAANGGAATGRGDDSILGTGGAVPGVSRVEQGHGEYTYTVGTGGNASGYGAGGGGAAYNISGGSFSQRPGGKASVPTTVSQYDISGLANPKLVITIGAPGAPGTGAGAGSPGIVKVTTYATVKVNASVVPLTPTARGNFVKAANATGNAVFPDLGPGMWLLNESTANGYLGLNKLKISSAGDTIQANYNRSVCFVADIRPEITVANSSSVSIDYVFYSMREIS